MRLAITPWANEWIKDFDSFFESALVPENNSEALSSWLPATDVEETEKEYKFSLDIPGIPKEDIKVEFLDGKLQISGERKSAAANRQGKNRIVERQLGKFERTFMLGHDVDAGKVEAPIRMAYCPLRCRSPKISNQS